MFRALIVDDIEIIRTGIAMKIHDSSCPIISAGTAENGEAGLIWLSSNYADFCITDIKMPVMDGLEMIKEIGRKYPWIITIIISSYDDFSYCQKSIQLEAVDYIIKPVEQVQLDDALGKAMNKAIKLRMALADSILLSYRTECSTILDTWVESIKLNTSNTNEMIMEITKRFSQWVGERYFLMEYLASEWLNTVFSELKVDHPKDSLKSNLEKDKFNSSLLNIDSKEYFLSRAIQYLSVQLDYIKSQVHDSKGAYQRNLIEKLNEYIQENYMHSNLTLQAMADYAALSKSYMSTLYKGETGDTIWNKVIDLRIRKAKELLTQPDTKIYEVASQVGYTDYIHFSRLFKEYNGISALDYRKKAGRQ